MLWDRLRMRVRVWRIFLEIQILLPNQPSNVVPKQHKCNLKRTFPAALVRYRPIITLTHTEYNLRSLVEKPTDTTIFENLEESISEENRVHADLWVIVRNEWYTILFIILEFCIPAWEVITLYLIQSSELWRVRLGCHRWHWTQAIIDCRFSG